MLKTFLEEYYYFEFSKLAVNLIDTSVCRM